MTAIKMYEKIEKHYNEHNYEIIAAENVPGGAAYTVDRYVAYFMPYTKGPRSTFVPDGGTI